jgi:hypothetical protein
MASLPAAAHDEECEEQARWLELQGATFANRPEATAAILNFVTFVQHRHAVTDRTHWLQHAHPGSGACEWRLESGSAFDRTHQLFCSNAPAHIATCGSFQCFYQRCGSAEHSR